MSTQFAVAPTAPGSLGSDVHPDQLMRYLEELGRWRDQRRVELDALDEAALQASDRQALTPDVTLSMSLWKAVADRHDLLLATWDSGRVGETERRRLTTLIWGGLDQQASPGSALALSLPEACRLSDSLASSLRSRLRLDGSEPDVAARLRDLRAQVERIRDQVEHVPAGQQPQAEASFTALDRRLDDVAERARRGADVGGMLGPLEIEAATTERNLIVAAARGVEMASARERAQTLRTDLAARGDALRSLAAQVVSSVVNPPRLAIPDVAALGPVPADEAALTAYQQRLGLVDRALTQAHTTYAAALEQRTDQAERSRSLADEVAALPEAARADVAGLVAAARSEQEADPVDLRRVQALNAAVQAYLQAWNTTANRAAGQRRS